MWLDSDVVMKVESDESGVVRKVEGDENCEKFHGVLRTLLVIGFDLCR